MSEQVTDEEDDISYSTEETVYDTADDSSVTDAIKDKSTTKLYETFEDATDVTTSEGSTDITVSDGTTGGVTTATESRVEENETPALCPLSGEDFLKLEGRKIKSEDFQWARCPIPTLAETVVKAAANVRSTDLQNLLNIATGEQKLRILDMLPLDLPLEITLPILDDGIYWRKLCLQSWPRWDVWRYSDNWKSMFIHRSVQELIENFIPDKDDIQQLCKNIEIYSKYVTSLQICKLAKTTTRKRELDVNSETFDLELDDIIPAQKKTVYLNFEKLFQCFPHLLSLKIALSPSSIDWESFHFNSLDFNCLLRATEQLKDLQKLKITNRNFSNQQISTFSHMLITKKSLRELNFSFNFMDDYTCYSTAKLLISNQSLENLNLMYNKITDEGAVALASALYSCSNLKKLNLSLNIIGDHGTAAIVEVLLRNNSLTYLDLSKNKITEKSGTAFAELVKINRILRVLKIQENFLGKEAGKQLAEAVKENDHLLELNVRFCGFTYEDEGIIHQTILRNRSKVPYKTYEKNYKDVTASEFLF